MRQFHIAQVNIGRIKGSLEDPLMAGFVARLGEINALADCSPGFACSTGGCATTIHCSPDHYR